MFFEDVSDSGSRICPFTITLEVVWWGFSLLIEVFLLANNSRKKPTPKTAPTAICVELTGRPNVDAIITVMAAESAIQNARTRFNFVIF